MEKISSYLKEIAECTKDSGISVCETNAIHSAGYLYEDFASSIRDLIYNQLINADASYTENASKMIRQFEKSGSSPSQTAATLAIALNAMCKDRKTALDLVDATRESE